MFLTPIPFYATQIINPFLNSRNSVNHNKVERIQLMVKSLERGLFLYCRISFYKISILRLRAIHLIRVILNLRQELLFVIKDNLIIVYHSVSFTELAL